MSKEDAKLRDFCPEAGKVKLCPTGFEIGHFVTSWHLFVSSDDLFDCIIVADAASGAKLKHKV